MRKLDKTRGRIITINVNDLAPNPAQPRHRFDERGLIELAASIKAVGVLQPLTVRLADGRYELIAGERRLRASKLAGLTEVPCIVVEVTQKESSVLALVENLQRSDLDFFEVAEGYRKLIEVYGLTQADAAAKMGLSQSGMANKLRLLRYNDEAAAFIRSSGLTERHARAALRIEDADERLATLRYIAKHGMTVAQTEEYIDKIILDKKRPETKQKPHAEPVLPKIRDIRVFLNTIDRAVDVMKNSGIPAICVREENERGIELKVTIPRHSQRPLASSTAFPSAKEA